MAIQYQILHNGCSVPRDLFDQTFSRDYSLDHIDADSKGCVTEITYTTSSLNPDILTIQFVPGALKDGDLRSSSFQAASR